MSFCDETQTFYPYRFNTGPDGYVLKVDTLVGGNDVDDTPHDYDVNVPRFSVKVPSLMTMKIVGNPGNMMAQFQAMFRNEIRNQIGEHSWVGLDGANQQHAIPQLQHAQTYYKGDVRPAYLLGTPGSNMIYQVRNSYPYHNALPAFGEGGQLLLGTGFPRVPATHQPNTYNAPGVAQYRRTYTRHDFRLHSNLSFDITEDFIRPGVNVTNQPHYSNPMMSDNNCGLRERTFAFYVCRGARLYVGDEMSDNYQNQVNRHTRTLYQQGSLVIFRGCLKVNVGVTVDSQTDRLVAVPWATFTADYLNKQVTSRRCLDVVERGLDNEVGTANNLTNPVIFLGNCESHLNSLSWGLNIDRSTSDREYCYAYLKMPENGVIEDIAPWNTGFGLIWARHQYERLWESVVGYPPGHPVPQFQAPQVEYYLRRILGLRLPSYQGVANEWWGRMSVNFPYFDYDVQPRVIQPAHPDTNILKYIRENTEPNYLEYRNIEHLAQWFNSQWSIQYLPPAPPHLPPIKIADGRYSYLKPGVKVKYDSGQGFEIDGHGNKRYNWSISNDVPGYVWMPWTQPKENELIQWMTANPDPNGYYRDEWLRWSVDGKQWIKWHYPLDYTICSAYLERIL